MLPKATAVLLVWSLFRPLAAVAQEPPGSDFVSGARVLLSDDFAGLPWGAALPNWTMRGGVGRLLNGRLAFEGGSTTRLTPNIATWPGDFTIEMDVQAPALGTDDLRNISWEFNNGDITAWYATLTLYERGQCSLLVLIADPGENQRVSCEWLMDAPNRFALWFENGRLCIYLNGKRIIDSNQMTGTAFRTAALVLSSDGLPVSFGSFRIAESTGATGVADVRQDIRSTVGGAVPPAGGPPRPGANRDALRRPALNITSPRSGDVLVTGMTYPISWQYQWDSGPTRIELLAANTRSSLWIAPSIPLDGSGTGRLDWRVFENLHTANDYFIRITSLSDSTLSAIVGPVSITRPTITLTSPRAGATFPPGELVPIGWTYTGKSTDRVTLTATMQGSSSQPFEVGLPIGNDGQGEYAYWMPQPTPGAGQYTIRVQSVADPAVFDEAVMMVAGSGMGGAGNPASSDPVYLQRAVAIFETQDDDKKKETAVSVKVATRGTTPGGVGKPVAEIAEAASSHLVATTEYPAGSTAELGLGVQSDIQPAECSDLVLLVDAKPSTRFPAVVKLDRWRFRVRVELFFSNGIKVVKRSDGVIERGASPVPMTQPINGEVPGPTEVDTPTVIQPRSHYDQLVSEVRLYIRTGDDDLRTNSEVTPRVLLKDGTRLSFTNINRYQGWSDNSTAMVSFPFNREVAVDAIAGLDLIALSASLGQIDVPGVSIGTDNWNLNSVEAIAVIKGKPVLLMSRSGNPLLHRFTGTADTYRIDR
ncbi:MAG: hypothetical protein FIB01_16620 [Gemmatimonadetes bacterium]|nr:hypothetical protein [Gemmatimonadota bacterium]